MSWEQIIGHEALKRVLEHALARPAPGYVFCGPSGIGKTALARGFAHALLEQPAEKSLEIHPDFLLLQREPQAKQIDVESVRHLMSQMYLSPAMGKRRVALIQEADLLHASASNSLLKAVEEPKVNNVYLFTATSYERMPQTLRSRLVHFRLQPRSQKELHDWLIELGAPMDQAKDIANIAGGCPGLAKRMMANQIQWQDRRKLIEDLLLACNGKTGARIEALQNLKKAVEKEDDPIEAWKEYLYMAMRLARERIPDAERFAEVAEGLILSWRYVGGPISPEIGLEWTAVRTSIINELRYSPSFLYPTYL